MKHPDKVVKKIGRMRLDGLTYDQIEKKTGYWRSQIQRFVVRYNKEFVIDAIHHKTNKDNLYVNFAENKWTASTLDKVEKGNTLEEALLKLRDCL